MENLQTEVIELEFLEFSKGFKTISEEDFARILLRTPSDGKSSLCLWQGELKMSFDFFFVNNVILFWFTFVQELKR
jgi:hypothetical protein